MCDRRGAGGNKGRENRRGECIYITGERVILNMLFRLV
jgi:hypothetical protein